MLASISRRFSLAISTNKSLNNAAQRWGLKLGAAHVVAGVTIDSAMMAVADLNKQGIVCTLDYLGEFVSNKEDANRATDACLQTLEAITISNVRSGISVKLTQIGLGINRDFCVNNMCKILDHAKKNDIFVRIDMENYLYCQMTLDILKELRSSYDNVGTVIQAYLFRAEQDVKDLPGVPLRLVKGAYKESAIVAYQKKQDVNDNYLKLIKYRLINCDHTAIASHDHIIIEKVKQFARDQAIPNTKFEFQMLYGMRTELQQQLVNEGYNVRVYIPFGEDWFGYFMRRLAERPQNISFAFRGLLSRK